MPTIAALLTRRAADDLLTLLRSIPDERLLWKPSESNLTVLGQLRECAIVNQNWAITITERGFPVGSPDSRELRSFIDALSETREGCTDGIERSTEALVAAINGVSEEDTDLRINIDTLRPGTITLAEACLYSYWHMVYHEGQINFLQASYGDAAHYHDYHVQG
ncbi:MAG: DinB family protein [Akkermansiaceae bacterium]|nr:DinB family protein [Armatimonadota bacterium]